MAIDGYFLLVLEKNHSIGLLYITFTTSVFLIKNRINKISFSADPIYGSKFHKISI